MDNSVEAAADRFVSPLRMLRCREFETIDDLLGREWLVTNGLGGFAAGTLTGIATRKQHGLLNAALPAPLGRAMMLNMLYEELRFPDDTRADLGGMAVSAEKVHSPGAKYLRRFCLENGLPVWHYAIKGWGLEKRVFMPFTQNTVFINYRLVEGVGPVRIRVRPYMHMRLLRDDVIEDRFEPYAILAAGNRYEVRPGGDLPILRFFMYGRNASFNLLGGEYREVYLRMENRRGYQPWETLWSPGFFRVLIDQQEATLVASTENWDTLMALAPSEALEYENARRSRLLISAVPEVRQSPAADMVLAADQFLIAPKTRRSDETRALAAGDQARTVIAGYPWFTDWGRDTMISLEGLTLVTGRFAEAGYILRAFAHHIRNGLIPNSFPEGESEGIYHTADATLWFFHALDRYIHYSQDRLILRQLLPKLAGIIEHHRQGTRFNIRMDPEDGLLSQGEEGYPLTWMDAHVDEWVVTPRRGKAVEINALWYNALRLMGSWCGAAGDQGEAGRMQALADRVYQSFNERFWWPEGGYLLDVVDGPEGDDSAPRPNQIFAVSLPYPVLAREKWVTVVEMVERELLTPFGLRSLGRGSGGYQSRYYGDRRARDAAYHQGTIWSWLVGPFVEAWMRVHPQSHGEGRAFLDGLSAHLDDACIGSISEIFDAESPFVPEGCFAQAWSVAEFLRVWKLTAPPGG
jgi:predicted glycogen debranching enzyme